MERNKNIAGLKTAADMLLCDWPCDTGSATPGTDADARAAQSGFSPDTLRHGYHELIAGTGGDETVCSALALAVVRSILADVGVVCLWVTHKAHESRYGYMSGRGMASFGLDPSRIVIARARGCVEALWAAEEAARSGAVAAIVAESDRADFAMTRRLALASQCHDTPIFLLLPADHGGPSAARSRWRIHRRPSLRGVLDPTAPGTPSWRLHLENRKRFHYPFGYQTEIAYDHETHRFDMVERLVAGQAVPAVQRAECQRAG